MNGPTLLNTLNAAFRHPLNVALLTATAIGFGVSAFISISTGLTAFAPWHVLFLGAGLEGLWLAFASRQPKLLRHLQSQEGPRLQHLEHRMRVLGHLQHLNQQALERFHNLSLRIDALRQSYENARVNQNLVSDTFWTKLAALEEQYARLLHRMQTHTTWLYEHRDDAEKGVDPKAKEIAKLEQDFAQAQAEQNVRMANALHKRLQLLKKREISSEKVNEALRIDQLEAQNVEDTIEHLLEQNLASPDPTNMASTIDGLLQESELRQQTLDELSTIYGLDQPLYDLDAAGGTAGVSRQ